MDVGFAVTEFPDVLFNPVDGLQVYVFAPAAFNVVDPPAQIDAALTVIVGEGFTFISAKLEIKFPQPLEETTH